MTAYAKLIAFCAHSLIYIVAIDIAAGFAVAWHAPSAVLRIANMVVMLCSWAMMFHRRSRGLCVRCMTEVPLDAPAEAQRRKSLLWLVHALGSRKGAIWLFVLLGVALALPAVVRAPLALSFSMLPFCVFSLVVVYGESLHHRLQPWCPYCRRWEDGGEHEPSPDPVDYGFTKVG